VRHRYHRNAHSGKPAKLGREHAAGDHHDLGVYVAAFRSHTARLDARHTCVREDPDAPLAGALGEGEREL
jgi:hypothetical protein